MIRKFLNKTFGIRDGEIYISFLMQIYIFLVITVLLIIKPIINALFLSELGAKQLPYGYLLVALVAIITTYFYNKWIKKFSFKKVTSISLIVFALSFIVLAIIIKTLSLSHWLLYFYYISVSLFAVITTSQFWILANLVFNTREAKRLFGFIGAGAIAGGVFGGYLTSVIVSSFGNVTAIIVAVFLLLLCIPILHKIWNLRIKKLSTHIRAQRKHQENSTTHEPAFKIISKSKHLTYLALITGLSVIVAKLVDFQFSDFANRSIPNPDDLASFFGFWFSTFNVIALCFQLFLTNRILSKLGVASTLLILPLGIALGSLLFLTFPELWVLVIIKGIDGSFKQSINKAAVELSIMPVPFNIKNQAKSFIDVAVDSIATGLAGIMLILLIQRFNLPTWYISIIVLFLTLAWIVLIYKLREAYFNSFRLNIQRNLSTESISNRNFKKEKTVNYTRQILQSDNEDDILALLNRLSVYKIKALKNEIINLLDFPSNKVKSETIKQLYIYDKGAALEKIKSFIYSNNDELVHTSLTYILERSNLSHNDFFSEYLDHEDSIIASAALLCLAKEVTGNTSLAKGFHLDQRINDKVDELKLNDDVKRQADIAKLLLTIAHSKMVKHYSYISVNLQNKNPYIVKHAIQAAGITSGEQFSKSLLEFLAHKTYRKTAKKALKQYGSNITTTILKLESNDNLSNTAKLHIPSLIGSFNTQKSVKILLRLLKSKDIIIRFKASKALNKLKSQNEALNINRRRLKKIVISECKYGKDTLTALASLRSYNNSNPKNDSDREIELAIARNSIISVLEEQLNMSLKTVFKILELLYDEADIKVSYSGLKSDVKEAQINAMEFLDNLLQSQIKTQILPLVEYYNVDNENLDKETQLQVNMIPEKTLLKSLIKKRGKRVKLEVLHLIGILKDKSYTRLVRQQTNQKSKEVSSFAKKTLAVLNQKK